MNRRRQEDASFDEAVELAERGPLFGRWPKTPHRMRQYHEVLDEAGLLEPDEPTPWTHYLYDQAAKAEFTPSERAVIRGALGLLERRAHVDK